MMISLDIYLGTDINDNEYTISGYDYQLLNIIYIWRVMQILISLYV
jgi:hypothetical protein